MDQAGVRGVGYPRMKAELNVAGGVCGVPDAADVAVGRGAELRGESGNRDIVAEDSTV